MKHHLTYKDNKSDKFWNIEVSGNTFTVTYGKTGTGGTSQTKSFSSEEKCTKEAEKLLNEKLKKGYVESDSIKDTSPGKGKPGKDYQKEWQSITNSKNPGAAPHKAFFISG